MGGIFNTRIHFTWVTTVQERLQDNGKEKNEETRLYYFYSLYMLKFKFKKKFNLLLSLHISSLISHEINVLKKVRSNIINGIFFSLIGFYIENFLQTKGFIQSTINSCFNSFNKNWFQSPMPIVSQNCKPILFHRRLSI